MRLASQFLFYALAQMSASAHNYLRLTFLFVIGTMVAGVLFVPLAFGVWLPDVFIGREHTLAKQRLASGHAFQVIQYWNHVDFYSTELRVTCPDGSTETHTLGGDDNKSWRLPLVIDEQHHTATVTLGGGRVRMVDWKGDRRGLTTSASPEPPPRTSDSKGRD